MFRQHLTFSAALTHISRYILLLVGVMFVVVYVTIAYYRVQYPFELEWIEGVSVEHIQRVLDGRGFYVPPSLEFAPYMYTPLYFYLSAAVATVTSISFLPLRLVSFVASIGTFIALFVFVRRETGSSFAGALSACLYAACFRISGAWIDIARVDSLLLFFQIAALYPLRFGTTWRSSMIAALLFGFAFLTKQTTLFIVLPLMLYTVGANWRRAGFFMATFMAIVLITTLFFDAITGGWYTFYVFELAVQHPIVQRIWVEFWTVDLFKMLPVACIVAFAALWLIRRDCVRLMFYVLFAVGTLAASYISRLHEGGYDNVLLPAYAMLCILFGVGVRHLAERWQAQYWRQTALYGAALAQFVGLIYNPLAQIPTPNDLQEGANLIHFIRQIEGDVFVYDHQYLAAMAGKPTYIHRSPLADITRSDDPTLRDALLNEVRQALEEQRFAAVVLDIPIDPSLVAALEDNYNVLALAFTTPDGFWTRTGWRTRPHLIYVPQAR